MTIPGSPTTGTYILDIEYGEEAHQPPTITATSPSGTQAQGITSVTLSATTNMNATCKYGTSNVAYASMPSTMSGTTTSHTATVSVTAGTSYTYYVRCQSTYGATMTSSNTITFSIPAAGLTSGGTMQSATTALCSSTAAGTTVNLTDTRDSKVYRVRKMADGRCWMIENLAFDLANSSAPAYNPTEQLATSSTTSVNNRAQYLRNSSYTTAAGQATYLYNWCAAMGDTSTNCATTIGYTKDEPSGGITGICPAPFRLPIGGPDRSIMYSIRNEFAILDIAMGGTGAYRQDTSPGGWTSTSDSSTAWNGVFSGGHYSGLYYTGSYGYWWSSTAANSADSHAMYLDDAFVIDFDNASPRTHSFAVRCVL
jgi:uncharacterized protein (TIGR02145 family)